MTQRNVTVEDGADPRKYDVRARLRFAGYNDQEIPGTFQPDDLLRVTLRNCCGIGIDVVRESDGFLDMVWPEEVDLA